METILQSNTKSLQHFFIAFFFICILSSLLLQNVWLAFIPTFLICIFFIKFTYQNLFYSLFIAIPISVEIQLTSSYGFDFPDEPILLLLTFCAPLLIYKTQNQKKINWLHPLFIIICLQIIWSIIVTLYSDRPLLGYKYVIAKSWFVIPAIIVSQVVIQKIHQIEKIFILFSFTMLAIALKVMLFQSFDHFSFEKVSRATLPFFRNHVNYSGVLLLAGPMLWWVFKHSSFRISKKMIFLVFVVYTIALYLAFSRGVWVALLVALFTVKILKHRKIVTAYFLASICIMSIFFYLNYHNKYLQFKPNFDKTVMHSTWQDHLKATIKGRDVSVVERYYRWIAATRMWEANPIMGVGPNQFYPTYKRYTVSSFRTWVSDNTEHSSIHQYFLLLLCEQGFLGAFLFWILFAVLLYFIQIQYHQALDAKQKDLLLVLLLIATMIFTLNQLSDLIETDKFGFLWFLVTGLVCNKKLFAKPTNSLTT